MAQFNQGLGLLMLVLSFHVKISFGFLPAARVLRVVIHSTSGPSAVVRQQQQGDKHDPWILASSFFGKFDEDDFVEDDDDDGDDDDDDDDDEYADMDDAAVANFRARMGNMFGDDDDGETNDDATTTSSGAVVDPSSPDVSSSIDDLISYARSQGGAEEKPVLDWAKSVEDLEPGVVLVANPAKFCTNFGGERYTPSPTLLSKFGLTLPPPVDLGPDRRADLLPVLMVVESSDKQGTRAVLLNRRTGYLLGDLEQPPAMEDESPTEQAPILEKFCIQPLWFGGVDNVSSGLDMLHQCPKVVGAKSISEDGLFWGGDPAQAQDAMSDPELDRVMTGFDFKFFVQSTLWSSKEIKKEIDADVWFKARVSKEVLFKSRDRMGTRRAKPLWAEIMELMGDDKSDLRDKFYDES